MDAFKAIIESGYILQEQDFYDLLSILNVTSQINSVHELEKTISFFIKAAKLLSFDATKVADYIGKDWLVDP
jgi:hypothetical protein